MLLRFSMKWLCLLVLQLASTVAMAAFTARPIQILIPERGNVAGYEITEQTNKYQLIAPPMMEQANVEESITKLTLKPINSEFLMSLQFTTNYLATTGEKKLETAQTRIMARYPQAEILESGITYTGNGAAFFYDILWGEDHKLHSKVVVQELEGRICELIFSAGRNEYAAHLGSFGNFLSSFRILRK
ncbi:MAG: hypothetical protein JWN25_2293 [Verrucomicrobiales bacterium]|nr:hypothetical protein [Verrucomicrobiales bacterium]MDB6130909.1 hypothetical protein [Verrucomicrobiales bacterium]